jgi:hypothetical protein
MDDLRIPDFLRRCRNAINAPLAQPVRRRRYRTPPRPQGERWENAKLVDLYLYDEAPALGAGYRKVWVAEGRKWCKLASADGLSKAKIPMSVWAEIARRIVL